jgi:hypothetical protein
MLKPVTAKSFIITAVVGAALIYGYLSLNEWVQETARTLSYILAGS